MKWITESLPIPCGKKLRMFGLGDCLPTLPVGSTAGRWATGRSLLGFLWIQNRRGETSTVVNLLCSTLANPAASTDRPSPPPLYVEPPTHPPPSGVDHTAGGEGPTTADVQSDGRPGGGGALRREAAGAHGRRPVQRPRGPRTPGTTPRDGKGPTGWPPVFGCVSIQADVVMSVGAERNPVGGTLRYSVTMEWASGGTLEPFSGTGMVATDNHRRELWVCGERRGRAPEGHPVPRGPPPSLLSVGVRGRHKERESTGGPWQSRGGHMHNITTANSGAAPGEESNRR